MSNTEEQKQAIRLLSKYTKEAAIKAAEKNAAKAVSDAQEEFWERVAEMVEMSDDLYE